MSKLKFSWWPHGSLPSQRIVPARFWGSTLDEWGARIWEVWYQSHSWDSGDLYIGLARDTNRDLQQTLGAWISIVLTEYKVSLLLMFMSEESLRVRGKFEGPRKVWGSEEQVQLFLSHDLKIIALENVLNILTNWSHNTVQNCLQCLKVWPSNSCIMGYCRFLTQVGLSRIHILALSIKRWTAYEIFQSYEWNLQCPCTKLVPVPGFFAYQSKPEAMQRYSKEKNVQHIELHLEYS